MHADPHPPYTRFLSDARATARDWLFNHALPLWWEHGADHVGGGFHETLDRQGHPAGPPERLRVQARQVFVYGRAGELGWTGPWQQAMRHGLDFMLHRYQRPDGWFRSSLDADGDQVDLYEQAFVLLALATAARTLPGEPRWLSTASRLLALVDGELRAEDRGADGAGTGQPQRHGYRAFKHITAGTAGHRSNPLMHLLEALLAWAAVPGTPPVFAANARALAQLALARLIQPARGGVGEVFADDWSLAEDLFEPGHQFEWAYLLCEADAVLGDLPAAPHAARRLAAFGSRHGVDAVRNVAIFSMDGTGRPLEAKARLWAQTERLRTALFMARHDAADRTAHEAQARLAFASLQQFLDVPQRGLWRDWMREDGSFIDAPSPASSLYHIVTGLDLLLADAAPAPAPSTATPLNEST